MRLGVATGIFGARDMPAHDARRLEEGASLGVSLAYLRDVLNYLVANDIRFYRLHDELVPGLGKRPWQAVEAEIGGCAQDLALLGQLVAENGIRLTCHPRSNLILNTPDEDRLARSLATLRAQVAVLDALAPGPESVIVLHIGGVYGEPEASRRLFCERYADLPDAVRRRIVVENDDRRYGLADTLAVHEASGAPVVFDPLHHRVLNPDRVQASEALRLALDTWPEGITPKIHYATARSDMRTWGSSGRIKPPTWTEHADFVNPFDFADLVRLADELRDFDIMLEAKARDLALLKLRQDLAKHAPGLLERLA